MKKIILIVMLFTLINLASAVNIDFDASTPDNGSQSETCINVSYTASDTNDTYSFIDFNSSLVGWWRMGNESTQGENATHVYDWSKSGNNGTVTNAVVNTTGVFGGSFDFDGSGDYINVGNDDTLNMNGTGLTISAWVNLNVVTGSQGILMDMDGPGNKGYGLWANGDDVYFGVNDDATSRIAVYNILTVDQWYHLLATYDEVETRLYVDGEFKINTSYTDDIIVSALDTVIGIYPDKSGWATNGTIDECLLFNRSLSAEEAMSLYNATLTSHNFTSLPLGDHTFTAYAVDNSSDMNQTAERTVTISTPPGTPDPVSLTHSKGETWVNHTWAAGSAPNVTDSYNVSMNSTWHNTTTVTYHNNTGLSALSWSNITVWAYNSTYDELSSGSVSENVQTDEAWAASNTATYWNATSPITMTTNVSRINLFSRTPTELDELCLFWLEVTT